jgi:hypothetical protein
MQGIGVDPDERPLSCLIVHVPTAGRYGEEEYFVVELGPGVELTSEEGLGATIEQIVGGYGAEYGLVWTDVD